MANEYGYEGGGSVLGGILDAMKYHDNAVNQKRELDERQAAVPFLNQTLAGYLHGATLPNMTALAPFVQASQGLSESGANTARAGYEGAETNRINSLLPGEVTAQDNSNQFNADTMADREHGILFNNLDTAARANASNAAAGESNARSDLTREQIPYIGPESLGRVLGQFATNRETNARANEYGAETGLLQPKFELEQQKAQYDMDPSTPEGMLKLATGQEANARGRNFDAETSMYQPQTPQIPQGGEELLNWVRQHQQKTGQTGQSQTGSPSGTQLEGNSVAVELIRRIMEHLPLSIRPDPGQGVGDSFQGNH